MEKFKLSRKRKKKWLKDDPSARVSIGTPFYKCDWEWFYFKDRIMARCLEVITGEFDKSLHRWDKFKTTTQEKMNYFKSKQYGTKRQS